MPRHVVAKVDEIPPGSRKLVTVEGREIVVFNLDGDFVGLLNRCPHQGGRMCDGVVTALITSDEPGKINYERPGEIIRCPIGEREEGFAYHRLVRTDTGDGLLEEIVCDADLSHLGNAWYWDRCGKVRQELLLVEGTVLSEQEWVD